LEKTRTKGKEGKRVSRVEARKQIENDVQQQPAKARLEQGRNKLKVSRQYNSKFTVHLHSVIQIGRTFIMAVLAFQRKQFIPSFILVSASFLIFLLPVIAIATSNNVRPLENIFVVGGTHGNEYTGVWVIKTLDRAKKQFDKRYPSLKITTLLANPEAHMQNKRFVDEDLNRKFSHEALMKDLHLEDDDLPHETIRAREIDQLLGPKFAAMEDDNAAHVVVDLHSTTSNMGVTIIVAAGDPVMTRAAAYVRQKCEEAGEKVHCLLHTHESRHARPNLSSTARHGFTIEVGPVPQGVVRHDAVEKTERALYALLDYMQRYNDDVDALDRTLKSMYEKRSFRVPCFKSASASRKQEMSGRIAWPSVPENPNFPALMVHKDLQDKDFQQVRTGDPLFVNLDGDVLPYDGSYGSPIYLIVSTRVVCWTQIASSSSGTSRRSALYVSLTFSCSQRFFSLLMRGGITTRAAEQESESPSRWNLI
jgi:succinylglutamate desuccinylase